MVYTRRGVIDMGKALGNLCLSEDIAENLKNWKQR